MTKANDPGLGSKFESKVERLLNQDGTYNIKRIGGLKGIRDIYKLLIDLSWLQFVGLAFITFLLVNTLFAGLYLLIGIDQLSGISPDHSDFMNGFFFSVQTLMTIGYGHISPNGFGANITSVIESFIGLMGIALMTGLIYGRFSKPSSKIAFSKNIIISPFREGNALMFKIVNQRNSTLLNVRVKVMLIMDSTTGDNNVLKQYHSLPLQIDQIHFFPLTWTIVHEIRDNSPLEGFSLKELMDKNAEVIVLIEAYDETHHQNIFERHSYAGAQWLENVRFKKNYLVNQKGEIELYIKELDVIEAI